MNKRIALFPGSFDPFTNGHLDTVERASHLFDKVIIGIFTNTSKTSFFTMEEKEILVQEATRHISNVQVISRTSGLTVSIAEELEANFLVRGIRNAKDYEYERDISLMNFSLNKSIETVFLLSKPEFSYISSSLIKEIITFGGKVNQYVPPNVYKKLLQKLGG